ncbi:MAG TPA: ATP-binding protein [Fluviicola sp.]|nr:ATP-binding protein [Fluviicola sp.]
MKPTEKKIIGRVHEQQLLASICTSNGSDLLAVTGRRRIGKTYLVRTYFQEKLHFDFSGVINADWDQQLQSFHYALGMREKQSANRTKPANWLEAFHQLTLYLDSLKTTEKKIVFIDEFPWLDTHKSNFLSAFDWFWNTWAVRKNILVIICGSATSWMIRKIINHKGGLHNRVTKRIHLEPFTLGETEHYLQQHNIRLNRYQVASLYMVFGGVPHYLNEIVSGESAMQTIQRVCFSKKGLLVNEFDNLYRALFIQADNHIEVVKALAKKRIGLSRKELLATSKLKDGGTFSKVLEELEWSGFIESYAPYGKIKKDKLFRLTDEFSLFYLTFMYQKKNVNWQQLAASPVWKSWSGYTFESICMKHLPQLKKALGIAAVYTECSSFISKGKLSEKGAQIDLLIDRNDQVINLCEMKFTDQPFIITKAYAAQLREKMAIFINETGTKKAVFPTLITSFGVVPNEHSIGLMQQHVLLDDLFLPA